MLRSEWAMGDGRHPLTFIFDDVPLDMHPDGLLGLGRALDQPDTLGASVYARAREAEALVEAEPSE